ncbi:MULTISPECIES: hypothetical protein [unclassified Streptomyces]|uniref:hypothetical protein n=1 Tax=unclassified Streptomyces TaxID=2593676 RepID=UPI002E31348A|nr:MULTISPECIES: hypothetical protein [unclassified Streptomyces]WUC65102.1 hypothetical protein OG861_13090 [Streptomyces sp. NBC_00539]
MIVEFAVRPGQGESSGFDLGDMVWVGELGEARSAGQSPDQGMMIYASVTQLLDCLHDLLRGRTRSALFTGVDSSFRLTFARSKKGIRTTGPSGPVSILAPDEFAGTVLAAAEELARTHLGSLPSDGVADDYRAALEGFRILVAP